MVVPGYGLWRSLTVEYEPRTHTRQTGLLQQILLSDFDTNDIMASLEKWERLVRQYELSTGRDMGSDAQAGIIISRLRSTLIMNRFGHCVPLHGRPLRRRRRPGRPLCRSRRPGRPLRRR